MTLKVQNSGLTPEDELRLSRAIEAAQGANPAGPWMTPEQYVAGGAELMRNQLQFASQNSRKALSKMAAEHETMRFSLSEQDKGLARASEAIEALLAENAKLKAENTKLRERPNGKARKS